VNTEKKLKKPNVKSANSLELVTSTAHDMKTPLVLINGMADRILNGDLSEEQKRIYLERIQISSTRLLKLVESLGDSHLLKLNKEPSSLKPVNANAILDEVIDELSMHAEHRHQDLVFRSKKNMIVLSHRVALYRIIHNLVDNAIRYSRPNSQIEIKINRMGGEALISVKDSGPGFRKDDLDKIFNLFGRVSEPTNAMPGSSGMGLYISRQLADSIEGSLYVTPQKDGSSFNLNLPLAGQTSLF
jgi:signal transduction histidine kinase